VPDLTWVYAKSLWSLKYEMLYSSSTLPWNVIWYLYYIGLSTMRRRIGYGAPMKVLQAPLRWSGLLVNPLEPDSDVCNNRSAIMKEEQLSFLKTVRSVKSEVVGLGDRTVKLGNGEAIEADYLVCATGYDRRGNLPKVEIQAADGTLEPHPLAEQHGFYRQMI